MFRPTYRISPPDLILVEVLEALPGRNITGERLVRPDGTISLGFYGDVDVTGLTIEQAKVKIVLHLRRILTDEVLALLTFQEFKAAPAGPAGPLDLFPPGPVEPVNPFNVPPPGKPLPSVRPGVMLPAGPNASSRVRPPIPAIPTSRTFLAARRQVRDGDKPDQKRRDGDKPAADAAEFVDGVWVHVEPRDSARVFVDVTAYNSKVYYVLGHVSSPGRLPVTGAETVLDAIQYAGGVLNSGDRTRIKLNRPARGGTPARDYTIDLDEIEAGKHEQNLQLFPGDRLVVPGRAVQP